LRTAPPPGEPFSTYLGLLYTALTGEKAMRTLEELRQILSPQKKSLCAKYKITQLSIFGSYARGEQTETSDVDFLVDYSEYIEKAPTLIDLIELRSYLSELLDMKVDIVTRNGLKPRIRDRVLAEATYI
jgi:uncharacterized protein